MERVCRRISLACFVVAALSLLLHATALVMRLTMDIRQVYPVDFLITRADAGVLGGIDAFIYHLLRNGIWYGVCSQVMFLLAQLLIQVHDVIYVKKWMEINSDTQIKLLKENEKELIGLADRVIPLLALLVFAILLVREWASTNVLMSYADLTRRMIVLPILTFTAVSWAFAFFLSLMFSLITLWYFRSRMLRIFDTVNAES